MAYTIYQQPQQNYLVARSPLIVVAGDSAVSDSDYRVVIKVYAWEGDQSSLPSDPIATLDKAQDDDGRAKFNIAPILEDLFTPNDPASYLLINTYQGMIYNLVMQIGYTNGGSFQQEAQTSVRKVVEGYGLFPQLINTIDDSAAILNTTKFLTPRPTPMYAIKGQPMWFSFFYQGTAISNSGEIYWIDTDGNAKEVTINTIVTTDPPINSDNFLVRYQSTSGYLDSQGLDTDLPVTISLDKTARNDAKTINFQNEICNVGSDTICFVNRYGVWDWLHVYATQRKGVEVDRITYDRRISTYNGSDEVTYSTHNAAKTVLRSKATQTYEVNTGWISEAHNDLIQDMMLSKDWFSFNLDVAVYLTDTEKQYKLETDSDLISYTFRFEVASNLIQDIQ